MGPFTPSRQSFKAIGTALGLNEDDAALTKIDLTDARPRYDLQRVVESGNSTYRQFLLQQTDGAGGATTLVDVDVRAAGDWTQVLRNGRVLAGDAVPEEEDAWVTGAFITATATANFGSGTIFSLIDASTLATIGEILYFGAASLGTFDSPPRSSDDVTSSVNAAVVPTLRRAFADAPGLLPYFGGSLIWVVSAAV